MTEELESPTKKRGGRDNSFPILSGLDLSELGHTTFKEFNQRCIDHNWHRSKVELNLLKEYKSLFDKGHCTWQLPGRIHDSTYHFIAEAFILHRKLYLEAADEFDYGVANKLLKSDLLDADYITQCNVATAYRKANAPRRKQRDRKKKKN